MGLREDKKAATRAHLSDVATALFLERGFESVSIADIAAEADVSRPTVIAYYPRKTDLVFDRAPGTIVQLAGAVATLDDRSPADRLLDALVQLLAENDPTVGVQPRFAPFWRLVASSPALVDRARELSHDLERAIADALQPTRPDDADLTAALLVAAARTVYLQRVHRVLAGDHPGDDYRAALTDALHRATAGLDPASSADRPPSTHG